MTETPVPPTTVQKFSAEVIGTFVLVLFGCGTAVITGGDLVATGLSFGLAVMLMAYAVGRVSGGHFNPAVTLAAIIGGRLPWSQAGLYMGAQVLGGLLGGGMLLVLLLGFDGFQAFDDSIGANGWGDDGTGYALWAALLIELVLTAIFVFVILAVTDERNEHPAMAPLVIGLTLTAIHFVAINATGTSVNPARSIGAAAFSGTDPIIQLWVFILAPLLGGLAGGLLYPALFGRASDPVPGSGLSFSRPAAAAVPGYGMPDQYQQQWNQQSSGYPAASQYPTPTGQQDPAQQAQQAGQQQSQQGWGEQPIIQDGWQWDPQAQQWIPAQQAPQAPQAQWPSPDTGGGQTQVRPPDGV
ncbi:MAG: MIP family channel protein [Nocardioides sp.]|nr:MIP family channel protein [Nocardioides sp.]